MFKNVRFFKLQYSRSFSKLFSDWLMTYNGLGDINFRFSYFLMAIGRYGLTLRPLRKCKIVRKSL